ncbi:hypothetical protein C8R44DRAFT_618328 [Mycena epipterygia]|nr:hypothetical protein C8R44DRAFT_618328 [Mycena epipterygia]
METPAVARGLIAPSPESLVACPARAAPWFVEARAQLTKSDLGCHFNALLAAWTRLEDVSRYEHSGKNLSATLRPSQVTAWITSARGARAKADLVVKDATAYAGVWQSWWDSLQPEWRIKGADGRWETEEYGGGGEEWGPLYRWGVNGTLSLLAALYFWGCNVRDESEVVVWEAAVTDVLWMLEGMAKYYEKFNRKF